MSDLEDETTKVRDIAAIADLGLQPGMEQDTEARARARFIRQAHVDRRPRWRRAAHDRAAGSARPRTVGRVSRRVGMAGVGVLIVGGTAVASTTVWSPFGSDAAEHPTVATTSVPADEVAALAVLRRDQTDADRSPAATKLIRVLSPDVTGGVHLDSVRVLRANGDGTTILVAADRDGSSKPELGNDERHDVVCMVSGNDNSGVHGTGTGDVVSVAGSKCATTKELKAGELFSGGQYAGRLELHGIVPDGVAKVEVRLRDGHTVSADVQNNSFSINTAAADGSYEDAPIHWLGADGNEVPKAP